MTNRAGGRRTRPGERGQAVVELVLVLPLFLLLVFGMIEFGKAFDYWNDLTHLSNEGARYAAVNRWPTCAAADGVDCAETLHQYLRSASNFGQPGVNDWSVGTNPLGPPASGQPDPIIVCFPAGATAYEVGDPVRVSITVPYKLPVINGFLGIFKLPPVADINLHASSTMRIENTGASNPSIRILNEDNGAC